MAGGGEGGGEAGQRGQAVVTELTKRASQQPLAYLGGAAALGVFVGMLLRGKSFPG